MSRLLQCDAQSAAAKFVSLLPQGASRGAAAVLERSAVTVPEADYSCRRCLLSGLSDKQYYDTVHEYIASLPEYIKAAPDEYRRRLSLCVSCGELFNGICRQCGCFVEARAAKKNSKCAKDSRIW